MKTLENKINDLNNSRKDDINLVQSMGNDKPIYTQAFLDRVLKEDIYSVGVMLIHCIDFIPSKERIKRISKKKLKYLLELCDQNYSVELKEIIEKMMKEDPNERISLEEIKIFLSKIQNDE